MALAILHTDRLFFAIGQMGPVHDWFAVRICVDQYIDSLQFVNSEMPGVIRVSRIFHYVRCATLTRGCAPARSAVHTGIDAQIPRDAVAAIINEPRSWNTVVHGGDPELPDRRNISSVHIHGKRRKLLLLCDPFYGQEASNTFDQVMDLRMSPAEALAQFSMFSEVKRPCEYKLKQSFLYLQNDCD